MPLIAALLVALAGPATADEGRDDPAGSWAAGPSLGVTAARTSAGQHQLRPQIGAWGSAELSDRWSIGAELGASRRVEGASPARIDQRSLRAAATAELRLGAKPTHLVIALGPAATWRDVRIEQGGSSPQRGSLVQPGLRYRVGLRAAPGDRWRLDAMAGGATRGTSRDYDLVIQWGPRW